MNLATVKARLESYPRLYLAALSVKRIGHWSRAWIVQPDTDITIEGYPRSGNSFARSAFQHAAGDQHKIATHVHSFAQVVRSAQLGIPTMVLLRAPRDACLSLVALSYQISDLKISDALLARAKIDLINNFRSYRTFYENVLRVGDRVVIADFNLVTKDYGQVLQRMNQRYGTNFPLYENSNDNEAEVFQKGGFHLSPNTKRDEIKAALKSCLDLEELQPSIADAQAIYQDVLKLERKQAEQLSA